MGWLAVDLVPMEQDVVDYHCAVSLRLDVAVVSRVAATARQTHPSRKPTNHGARPGRLGMGPQHPCWVLLICSYLFSCVIITFNRVFCFSPFLSADKNGFKNLGKFISPPTKERGNLQLSYSDGSDCGHKKITSNITLVCKPGEPF